MTRLQTLIRLHKQRVDEARRHVSELELFADNLTRRMAALAAEVVVEQGRADESFIARSALPSYLGVVAERRRHMASSRATVMARVDEGRDQVAAAYREMKKYEVALAARQQRAAELAGQRERTRLDEVAMDGFRKRAANSYTGGG
ncbi:MAG: hypothetical protein EXQ87_03815 [Alphaproteobacteria bacterium]|nr:hypothetical protein [Alphaproteobacteria bacterium]